MIGSVLYRDSYFGPCRPIHRPVDLDEDLKLLIFWGGEDVDPQLYGEHNARSYCDPRRDAVELAIYRKAKAMDIPVLGICRGAQLLTVVNGGQLWQHVTGHGRTHYVDTKDGEHFPVTSTHHQMMRIPEGGELIAWSSDVLSPTKENCIGEFVVSDPEPEIVHYPLSKSLAVQGHPEYLAKSHPFPAYVRKLVKERLNVAL